MTAGRHALRRSVSVLLIVLGTILTPFALVGGWSKVVLTDTDAFVATYAPLIHDERLRGYLTDQTMEAFEQHVDIEALVKQAVGELSGLGLSPTATAALEALSGPAVSGVRSSVREATERAISSDAFATVWQESLRLTHRQTIAALRGDPAALLAITDVGLGLRIDPILQAVRASLSAQGFGLADRIPASEKTITIARSDQLRLVTVAYGATVAVGTWLSLGVLVLLAGGVVAAERRRRAALWVFGGLGAGAALVLVSVWIGGTLAAFSISPALLPTDVLQLFYSTIVQGLVTLSTVTLVLASVGALALWLTVPDPKPALVGPGSGPEQGAQA